MHLLTTRLKTRLARTRDGGRGSKGGGGSTLGGGHGWEGLLEHSMDDAVGIGDDSTRLIRSDDSDRGWQFRRYVYRRESE